MISRQPQTLLYCISHSTGIVLEYIDMTCFIKGQQQKLAYYFCWIMCWFNAHNFFPPVNNGLVAEQQSPHSPWYPCRKWRGDFADIWGRTWLTTDCLNRVCLSSIRLLHVWSCISASVMRNLTIDVGLLALCNTSLPSLTLLLLVPKCKHTRNSI